MLEPVQDQYLYMLQLVQINLYKWQLVQISILNFCDSYLRMLEFETMVYQRI